MTFFSETQCSGKILEASLLLGSAVPVNKTDRGGQFLLVYVLSFMDGMSPFNASTHEKQCCLSSDLFCMSVNWLSLLCRV